VVIATVTQAVKLTMRSVRVMLTYSVN
jgi:hypothetical protein